MSSPPISKVCFYVMNPGHNNVRYANLFPRLSHLIKFHTFQFSEHKPISSVQYKLWRRTRDLLIYPGLFRLWASKYDTLYTVDYRQIPSWSRDIIVDHDDFGYKDVEIARLSSPNVKALIVTTEKAKSIFQERGLKTKIYVIPQGVSFEKIIPARVEQIRDSFKGNALVVGFAAPILTLSSEGEKRAKRGIHDVDILLEGVAQARQAEPRLKVWLLGTPSDAVKAYAAKNDWVRLLGYIPAEDVLNYIQNFDIGAYPRIYKQAEGRSMVKIAQYMACGLPVVSMNVAEGLMVGEIGCGLVADSTEGFGDAIELLAKDSGQRAALGRAGHAYAVANLDWNLLVKQYEKILAEN